MGALECLQQITYFARFIISRLTCILFFFRLQLLLPAAQRILEFVYCVLAHSHPEKGVVRTGSAGRKTCPVKEDVGFTHQSEIGCTKEILVKVSQSHGLGMFRSILKMDSLSGHSENFF